MKNINYHKIIDTIILILSPRIWTKRVTVNHHKPMLKGQKKTFSLPLARAVALLVSLLFSYLTVTPAYGQEPVGLGDIKPLQIGRKVPDDFWTREHLFYVNGDTLRKTLEEHKGKMLVLGFWATWCSSCLQHQKTMASYLAQYADKLSVVKVNSKRTRDSYKSIDRAIKGIVGKHNQLDANDFISIIEDDQLLSTFPHDAYPHYVWINKNGIVQTFTYRNLLDANYNAPFVN